MITDKQTQEKEDTQVSTGDLVKVQVKVKEAGKERLQAFEGTVISIKGSRDSRMFTVRKIGAGGIGIERIWPLRSPSIQSIEVLKHRPQRRAKLYYLRKLKGKEATGSTL